MGRLTAYLAVTALGLSLAFWLATSVAAAVSASLQSSAQMIDRARR